MFAGKAPTDEAFKDGLTLPEFVGEAFPDKMEQILDPALLLDEALFSGVVLPSSEESELRVTAYDCLVSAVRVGLSCCRQAPCQRMAMTMRMQLRSCARSEMPASVPMDSEIQRVQAQAALFNKRATCQNCMF